MDAPIPSLFGRVTAVLGEHTSLYSTAKRLRALCAKLATGDGAARAEAARAFVAFLDDLTTHFATEEADDYFGLLVSERPALRSEVERLLAEHNAMTEAGGRIRAALANGTPSPELAADITSLLDTLGMHERRENVLLQDFFSRDEGGG